jgi:hypothetical protein
MRFQFTIGRMLFATAAFAAVLGLFAPFDALSIVCAIPISCSVFAFALVAKWPQQTTDPGFYTSRRSAIVAGIWRGALFGGKWTAVATTSLLMVLLVCFSAKALNRWQSGERFLDVMKWLGEGIGLTLFAWALITAIPTAASALFMGVVGGVNYPNVSNHAEQRNLSSGSDGSGPAKE